MRPAVALFDLDGTLSDSAPGMLHSLRLAFAELGIPPLDHDQEIALLGPPFYDTLPPYVGADRVADVIAAYRRHYSDGGGMLVTSAYTGVADLLAGLRAQGVRLAVATSKPEQYAPAIVAHLGLGEYFDNVSGDDLAGTRRTKALVIAQALTSLGSPDPDTVIMVGDRLHDVNGARVHGISTLGAGWGYGAPGELEQAGAQAVFAQPSDLAAYLDA
jgi:phosphoglycolate phosphatase